MTQQSKKVDIPPEVPGWSWGAFVFGWIWGICNRVWISLLLFIPIVNIVMPFVLGVKGRQWAWEKGKWRDLEHFNHVQRLWSIWGVAIFCFQLVVVALIITLAIISENPATSQLASRVTNYRVVQNAIGTPITSESTFKGTMDIHDSEGFVDGTLRLKGSKGEGHAYIKAYRFEDAPWEFVDLTFTVDSTGHTFEIVKLPEQSMQRRIFEVLVETTKIFTNLWGMDSDITSLKTKATEGDPKAQYILGAMYKVGEGIELDQDKALKWLKTSADQGDAPSQHAVAVMYENGEGVKQNFELAFEWYKLAAESGDPLAQFNVAEMLYEGIGTARNEQAAFPWYQRAANHGYAAAQFMVGTYYDEGKVVTKDTAQAFEWFMRSAEQAFAPSEYVIGVFYDNGDIVQQNSDIALKWYMKAANEGYDMAQLMVGFYYQEGLGGLDVDPTEAKKWFEKAAAQGNPLALEELNSASSDLADLPDDGSKTQ